MPTVTRIPIFGQLEVDVIVRLCQMLNTLPALEGSPVILQGRVATEMYIINSGRLQVPLILLSHLTRPLLLLRLRSLPWRSSSHTFL